MQHTLRWVSFGEVVLVTPQPMELPGVRNIVMPMTGDFAEYRRIEVLGMANLFKTEFCLRQHWDSLLVNPAAWDNNWLRYDYIGAPWHHPKTAYGKYPITEENCVGNGGFTLMSYRIAEMIPKVSEPYDPTVPGADLWICVHLRGSLMHHGIQFAPFESAYRFACEDRVHCGQFGLHGKATLKLNGINLEALDAMQPL